MPTPPTDHTCECLICGDYASRERLDAIDLDLIATVRRHGWTVVAIPDGEPAAWAFTIGLWHHYGSPEIAMFGLDPHTMHRALNAIGAQIALGKPAQVNDGIKPVTGGWQGVYCGAAMGFYRDSAGAVPFFQMLWPDSDGRFPGRPGCAQHCRDGQPHLWLPYEEQPSAWTRHIRLGRVVPGVPTEPGGRLFGAN
jgi:hypothetical protein